MMSVQMEVNSMETLCKFLISCAFQRCRMLDDLCRLSVTLKPSPRFIQISVSDTGVGSILEEFKGMECHHPILTGRWDGVLCIATTSLSDKEIHHLKYDMKEVGLRRHVNLPPATKNGAKFSGTEVTLSVYEQIDDLLESISVFIQKMLVLKPPRIAIELSVDSGGTLGPQFTNIISQNACNGLPMDAANVDYLKLGLEEYVCKHGNKLVEACHSCFSTESKLKFGTGTAFSTGNQQKGRQVMDVVILISEISQPAQSSCFRLYDRKTEVLYFRDFTPCTISQSSLDALTTIDWKNYGLSLKSVVDQDGVTLLAWEDLPPDAHIDIVLHRYPEQVMTLPCTQSNRSDKTLIRKAVKLALNDLKERNAGALLSERANKICDYAPDLAKTISGLILSSHDLNFQEECLSLLGLQNQEQEKNVVEDCIKDKIISVIATNDRNRSGAKDTLMLFADDVNEEPYYYEEYEEGEETSNYLLDM